MFVVWRQCESRGNGRSETSLTFLFEDAAAAKCGVERKEEVDLLRFSDHYHIFSLQSDLTWFFVLSSVESCKHHPLRPVVHLWWRRTNNLWDLVHTGSVHQHSGCSEAQCSDDQDGQDLQGDISKTLFRWNFHQHIFHPGAVHVRHKQQEHHLRHDANKV